MWDIQDENGKMVAPMDPPVSAQEGSIAFLLVCWLLLHAPAEQALFAPLCRWFDVTQQAQHTLAGANNAKAASKKKITGAGRPVRDLQARV